MARTATAWVEVRPDLSGFAKELQTKLAAMKQPTLKLDVKPETTAGMKQLKKATAKAGDESADEFAKSFKRKIGRALPSATNASQTQFRAAMAVRMRHAAEDAARNFREQWLHDMGQIKVDEHTTRRFETEMVREFGAVGGKAAREMVKSINAGVERDVVKPKLDKFQDQLNLGLRHAAEDAARTFRDEFRRVHDSKLLVDESTTRKLERAMTQRYGAMGTTVARQMVKSMNAEADREFRKWVKETEEKLKRDGKSRFGKIGQSWAASVGEGFISALSATSGGWSKLLANPIGLALIAAGGAVALTVVASWVGALTAAFAGVAGLGFGAFLLKDEPEVDAAARKLGTSFVDSFRKAAAPMKEGLLTAISVVQGQVDVLADRFGDVAAGLSDLFLPLARGLTGFVDRVMAGLQRGMPAIEAATRTLSEILPDIGEAIGDIFEKLAENPEAIESAMRGLGTAIVNVTNFLGSLISTALEWEGRVRHFVRNTNEVAKSIVDLGRDPIKFGLTLLGTFDEIEEKQRAIITASNDARDNLINDTRAVFTDAPVKEIEAEITRLSQSTGGLVEDSAWMREQLTRHFQAIQEEVAKSNWETFTEHAKDAFEPLTEGSAKAVKAVEKLIGQLQILDKGFMDSEKATSQYEDGIDDLSKALKDNGKELRLSEKAGRENRALLREQASRIEDVVKARLGEGRAIEEVNAEYVKMRDQLIAQMRQFGLSETAAKAYADQLLATPDELKLQMKSFGFQQVMDQAAQAAKPRTIPFTFSAPSGQAKAAVSAATSGLVGSMFSLGQQMMNNLASGMASQKALGFLQRSMNIAMNVISRFIPHSPAKEGPLAGTGDPFRSGRIISLRLADGMTSGLRQVSAAGLAVANAASTGLGFVGDSALAGASAAPNVSVFIGTERLDERIDFRVEHSNEHVARLLFGGRTGG